MEKYSVLMSLYIKEKPEYLDHSIQSMLNQTVTPDEIVIVKDGPLTKELENVLGKYLKEYPEIVKTVVSEKNIGLGLALNLGLQHCKNELVARMDTDDISLPDRCEKQLKAFGDKPDLDILSGAIAEFIEQENNIVGRRKLPTSNIEIRNYLKKRCPMNHVAVMFKKSRVVAAGGYKDWYWNEDYYLWIRMFENNSIFGNLSGDLVNVRVGANMYKRRGGIKYFKSEAKLQKYMLDKGIISPFYYVYNVMLRFTLQVIMPNKMRGFVFKKFARTQ